MDIEMDLKKISERFNNGTETMNDIINYCRNNKITFANGAEINVIEKKYFDKLVEKIKELEEENKKHIVRLTDKEYRRVIDIAQKDILKQLIDECIPIKVNLITHEMEYTPNVNSNSYLVQRIFELLEESEDK